MSINLTLEKPESTEEPAVKYTKRIDDLIEDAEIEAEIEAERKIRAKNTKIVAISIVAISLLVFLYYGIKTQAGLPGDKNEVEAPKVAKLTPKVPPKPIPFALSGTTPAAESKNIDSQPGSPAKAPAISPVKPKAKSNGTSSKVTSGSKQKSKTVSKEKAISFSKSSTKTKSTSKVRGTTMQALSLPAARSLNEPKSKPKAKASSPAIAPVANFFIQVGAFSNKANATRFAKKLTTSGFSASLGSKSVRQKTVHIVKVGGFQNSAMAKAERAKLGKAGFKNSFIFSTNKS